MIDKWFINDVEKVLSQHNRLVITDALGEGRFLMDELPGDVVLMEVAPEDLSEIEARYDAEQNHPQESVVFYTNQNKADLSFLLEYAETNGCVELDDMEQYIKGHLFAAIHENTEMPKEELLMAAKLSKGKDLKWWKGVLSGVIPPLDINQLLIEFLRNPKEMKAHTDKDVWKVFAKRVYRLINKPQTEQPAEIMVQTVMDEIFTGLVRNKITKPLLDIYYPCTDSSSMKTVMMQYMSNFTIPKDVSGDLQSLLKVHPDHPFVELDKQLFRILGKTLENGGFTESILHAISLRTGSKNAADYKAEWLKDLKTILEFKHTGLHAVSNIEVFCQYYQNVFSKLDTVIRHLYAEWLNEEKVLRPYQYLYEQQNKELLGKWFTLIELYTPTQKNILQTELAGPERTAIIVCDGLRLEIAETIASHFHSKKRLQTALAVIPSVTENGMSALFGCSGMETDAQKRYQALQGKVEDVVIMPLAKLNNGVTAEKLVLLYGNIDQLGEKMQLAALKDINGYETVLKEKISELHSMGYTKVVLTADHGFVITGILDEADKVDAPNGADKVEERFCLSNESLAANNLIEWNSHYLNSSYQYYAKTDKPFKTKGPYGYAHGGLTPQECIIPVYEFMSESPQETLAIIISNKKALKEVAGNHFTIKFHADKSNGSLFQQARSIKVQLYEHDKLLSESPTIKIKAGDEQELEYKIPQSGKAKVVVIDAQTKKQIDFSSVEKFDARGLNGLL